MKKVHLSFGILTVIGRSGYTDKETDQTIEKAMSGLEPDMFLDLNITEFMRIGFGAEYRLMMEKFEQLDTWDMSGFLGTVQVRFGGF